MKIKEMRRSLGAMEGLSSRELAERIDFLLNCLRYDLKTHNLADHVINQIKFRDLVGHLDVLKKYFKSDDKNAGSLILEIGGKHIKNYAGSLLLGVMEHQNLSSGEIVEDLLFLIECEDLEPAYISEGRTIPNPAHELASKINEEDLLKKWKLLVKFEKKSEGVYGIVFELLYKLFCFFERGRIVDYVEYLVEGFELNDDDFWEMASDILEKLTYQEMSDNLDLWIRCEKSKYEDLRSVATQLRLKVMTGWKDCDLAEYLVYLVECHKGYDEDIIKLARLLALRVGKAELEKHVDYFIGNDSSRDYNFRDISRELALVAMQDWGDDKLLKQKDYLILLKDSKYENIKKTAQGILERISLIE